MNSTEILVFVFWYTVSLNIQESYFYVELRKSLSHSQSQFWIERYDICRDDEKVSLKKFYLIADEFLSWLLP